MSERSANGGAERRAPHHARDLTISNMHGGRALRSDRPNLLDMRAAVRGTKSFHDATSTTRRKAVNRRGLQRVSLCATENMSTRIGRISVGRRTVGGRTCVGDATPDAHQPRLVTSPEGEHHGRVRRLPVPLSKHVPGFGVVDFPRAIAFLVAVGGYSFRSRRG